MGQFNTKILVGILLYQFPVILLEIDEILQHFKSGIWYKNLEIDWDIVISIIIISISDFLELLMIFGKVTC